jgi:hypothetical protein
MKLAFNKYLSIAAYVEDNVLVKKVDILNRVNFRSVREKFSRAYWQHECHVSMHNAVKWMMNFKFHHLFREKM